MEELVTFFQDHGLPITLIALAGIAILGVLKYCNLFKKLEEGRRHYVYLAISVGLSVTATVVYLLIVKQFTVAYVGVVACAIYALNQTFYNIFKITPVNDLACKLLDLIFRRKQSLVAAGGDIATAGDGVTTASGNVATANDGKGGPTADTENGGPTADNGKCDPTSDTMTAGFPAHPAK